MNIITAINLTKQFTQGSTTIDVLKNISISFAQGSTYAITGTSGSGKSTLLHLLAGIDTPTHGTVAYNSTPISSFSETERSHFLNKTVGLIFQLPYLIQELSVIENVALKGFINNINRAASLEQAHQLLATVGLADKAYAAPATLSGGQQQRVAIARALFNKPAFLLADEPTGNLDEKTGASIIDFINECQQKWHMGLIISTHDQYVAQKMKQAYHLHNGILTTA
jgi:ABC-type lipoprotein export system ATPase subunit